MITGLAVMPGSALPEASVLLIHPMALLGTLLVSVGLVFVLAVVSEFEAVKRAKTALLRFQSSARPRPVTPLRPGAAGRRA